jgi:hypothetical protein
MLMPTLSLYLTWFCTIIAAYISWTEEEEGEDGMELESDESDEKVSVRFHMKKSPSDEEFDPKYSICLKWKWFTIFFEVAIIIQACVTFIWFAEYAAVEELDDNDLVDGADGADFHEQMLDYTLHVLPFAVLAMEFMTNSQPMVDRHYYALTLPLLAVNLVSTFFIEHYYDMKLYMVDVDGVPWYNMTIIGLSFAAFYLLKGFSYAKLKIQGYPCDKILVEIEEYME